MLALVIFGVICGKACWGILNQEYLQWVPYGRRETYLGQDNPQQALYMSIGGMLFSIVGVCILQYFSRRREAKKQKS